MAYQRVSMGRDVVSARVDGEAACSVLERVGEEVAWGAGADPRGELEETGRVVVAVELFYRVLRVALPRVISARYFRLMTRRVFEEGS